MDWFVIHLVFVFFTCFTQGFNFSCQSVLRWNRKKESKGDTRWTKDYYIDINTKIMHHLFLRYRNFIACLLQFASLLFYQLSLPLQILFLPDKPACGYMRYSSLYHTMENRLPSSVHSCSGYGVQACLVSEKAQEKDYNARRVVRGNLYLSCMWVSSPFFALSCSSRDFNDRFSELHFSERAWTVYQKWMTKCTNF